MLTITTLEVHIWDMQRIMGKNKVVCNVICDVCAEGV